MNYRNLRAINWSSSRNLLNCFLCFSLEFVFFMFSGGPKSIKIYHLHHHADCVIVFMTKYFTGDVFECVVFNLVLQWKSPLKRNTLPAIIIVHNYSLTSTLHCLPLMWCKCAMAVRFHNITAALFKAFRNPFVESMFVVYVWEFGFWGEMVISKGLTSSLHTNTHVYDIHTHPQILCPSGLPKVYNQRYNILLFNSILSLTVKYADVQHFWHTSCTNLFGWASTR